jgi:anti-sigma regulatory factor (Ser/Thr protein kinase)
LNSQARHGSHLAGQQQGREAITVAHGRGDDVQNAEVKVEFDPGPDAASAARNALSALEPDLGPELLGDVRLLVSELVTNSVRHSNGDSPAGAVTLDVKTSGETVRVEVTDRGGGFDPKPREPGQSKASGWGLFLVDRLADRWGVVRNHVTRVWFEIDASGSRASV